MRALEIVGRRFGRWLVIARDTETPPGHALAICDCGRMSYVALSNLRSGMSRGCLDCAYRDRAEESAARVVGLRFGALTVVAREGTRVLGTRGQVHVATWRCRCDCGAEVVATGQRLRNGSTSRCVQCARNEQSAVPSGRLSVREAARMMQVAERTIWRWLASGDLIGVKTERGTWHFARADVSRAIQARAARSNSRRRS